MKTTEYFRFTRQRADRARIVDEWIIMAVDQPIREEIQPDGRFRRWCYVASEDKFLRVIPLEDGETIHNAFFERDFHP